MQHKLSELVHGERGVIVTVNAESSLRQRLLDMGFTPGTEIECKRYAPLRDPVEYKLKGYLISLRRTEADLVIVES